VAQKSPRTQREASTPPPAKNASWAPGRKGQGGEGLSKGYGGSAGPGVGPSGPENAKARTSARRHRRPKRQKGWR
jgi:hypothetical protein